MSQQTNGTKTFKIRRTSRTQKPLDQELLQVLNLQDLRLRDSEQNLSESSHTNLLAGSSSNNQNIEGGRQTVLVYDQDDENINCYRFPHSAFCGCENNCLLERFQLIEVEPSLSYGNFVSGLKVKELVEHGVTHVLNITSKEYTKQPKYFQYLNIDLHNGSQEDAKKFFRLCNRFIRNAISQGGKVFIHSLSLELGAVMAIAHLICNKKIHLKQALSLTLQNKTQISPHFMKQIEKYQLQKIAFVAIEHERSS